MEPIRPSTKEEIEALAATSELTPQSSVFSFKDARAVIRTSVELDPVYFGTLSIRDKIAFIWGLENILRALGTQIYYFNVAADDTTWRETVENWGATPTSTGPEIRYRKKLS